MVPFLHVDAGVLSQHLVDAAVFELGRLVYGEKIAPVNRERPARVLIGIGHRSQPMFPSLFPPRVLCHRVAEMPGQG